MICRWWNTLPSQFFVALLLCLIHLVNELTALRRRKLLRLLRQTLFQCRQLRLQTRCLRLETPTLLLPALHLLVVVFPAIIDAFVIKEPQRTDFMRSLSSLAVSARRRDSVTSAFHFSFSCNAF